MQTEIKRQKLEDSGILDCKKCNKCVVCTLYRGIGTLINNNWITEEVKPFKPENVAMICKYFSVEYKENL